jgi:hypothetical protein
VLCEPADGLSLADGTGAARVYAERAPVDAPLPFIVFSLQEGGAAGAEMALCGVPVLTGLSFAVRAWGRNTGYAALHVWEKRIDDLLSGARAEHAGWRLCAEREGSARTPPVPENGGTRLYAAGGVYRFYVTAAPEEE